MSEATEWRPVEDCVIGRHIESGWEPLIVLDHQHALAIMTIQRCGHNWDEALADQERT